MEEEVKKHINGKDEVSRRSADSSLLDDELDELLDSENN